MKRLAILLSICLFTSFANARMSLITGAVIIGGDKIYDYELESSLDRYIENLSASAGEVCFQTEHFIFDRGLSYASISLLKSNFESNRWLVYEISRDSMTEFIWVLSRESFGRTEYVLVATIELDTVGIVSLCSW